jgi:uncharacterized protein YjiS (DUF1127 family)
MHASSIPLRRLGRNSPPSWRAFTAIAIGVARASRQRTEHTVRRWVARQELKALLEEPDYVLRDIGITRHEILTALAENQPLRRSGS